MVKTAAKVASIFLLQAIVLLVLRNVIGNHFTDASIIIRSHSCDDNMVYFNPIIGLSIGGTLLALLLLIRPARTSTIWSFAAALALLDGIVATHMRGAGCM
jgi:hypothetical protein